MDERYCDFATLFPLVRAVREQVDWPEVDARSRDNSFAFAFLDLARRLELIG